MTTRVPAESFPPGDFIKEELEARGWSQSELADIMGRPASHISDLVLGKRAVSAEIAKELGAAFGTSGEYWMALEGGYRLWKEGDPSSSIARRAKLREAAPVREMTKRHWLEPSEDVSTMEQRVMGFFGISRIDEAPTLRHAARRGSGELTRSHLAWLFRARQLASAVDAAAFSMGSFERLLVSIRGLLPAVQEVRRVARTLAEAGIRLVIIEHLPTTKIDGVTFWVDRKPVIALSLRHDRIDCFWYTLAHELGHVKHRHGWLLDTGLVGDDSDADETEQEKQADAFAADFLIDQSKMDSFVARSSPLYSREKITAFARTVGVHPGIVVGQLQHRGEVQYSWFRPLLEKVRHIVTDSALTDGWGRTVQV